MFHPPLLQVSAPQRERGKRQNHSQKATQWIFPSMLHFSTHYPLSPPFTNLKEASAGVGEARMSRPSPSCLLIFWRCLLLCLKTHSCRWKVISSKIKVESLLNGLSRPSPPSLISRLWFRLPPSSPLRPSVIRSRAAAPRRKTATGDWQPAAAFTAVVSGGRRVSRMDGCQRDFTLPSCALTHTVLPLPVLLMLTNF